jgi:1,4-alpha-glucan branching enzyme
MRRGPRGQRFLVPIVMVSMLVTLCGMWSCTKTVGQMPPQSTPSGVKFTVRAPTAKHVSLVGSFNGWAKGATPMKVSDGALWSITVPLKEGEYTFMYLIDGSQWMTPPQAEDFVTDGFGQTNGIVIVR